MNVPILGKMNTAYYFTPTEHAAASVDEFLASCRALPEVAREHLAAGWFEAWLRDQGRFDLAERAEAHRHEGLEAFLKASRPARARRNPAKAADTAVVAPRKRTRKAA